MHHSLGFSPWYIYIIFYIESNNSEDRVDYLCKKRNTDKNIDYEENEIYFDYCQNEHLNKRLNNYHGYKNINIFNTEKFKHKEYNGYNGISLKEIEGNDNDDDLYKDLNDDDDLF